MNYDFLQNYNIPITRQSSDNTYAHTTNANMDGAYGTYSMQSEDGTPAINTAYYGYGHNSYEGFQTGSTPADRGEYYHNPERFIPPSKHGKGFTPYRTPYKRKHTGLSGGSAAKKEAPIAETTSEGKLVIFLGRDESYPDELNQLIHPLSCDLCNIKMNSAMLAKDHYESKGHDKHISSWLFKKYTEKGVNPPTIKRFVKQGPTGPEAFYCESCDLKLTSLTHANQHYAGKKHRMVIAQRAKPSGAGFYNSEGKWTRTGTKVTPNAQKRFGIGEAHLYAEITSSTQNLNSTDEATEKSTITTSSAADTTTYTTENDEKTDNGGDANKNINTPDQDPTLFCSICKVSVTSAVQMTMHLSGSKHMKKLKLAGLEPTATPIISQPESTVISAAINDIYLGIKGENKSDPSDMYRTPSGQYYCKTCNTSMSHLPGLEQHLKGKRHLKKLTEEKAMASLAAKKI